MPRAHEGPSPVPPKRNEEDVLRGATTLLAERVPIVAEIRARTAPDIERLLAGRYPLAVDLRTEAELPIGELSGYLSRLGSGGGRKFSDICSSAGKRPAVLKVQRPPADRDWALGARLGWSPGIPPRSPLTTHAPAGEARSRTGQPPLGVPMQLQAKDDQHERKQDDSQADAAPGK